MKTHTLSLPLAAAALLSLCCGCASMKCTTPDDLDGITIKDAGGKPGQMVLIQATGYYMFWSLPLASGDLTWNPKTKNIEGGIAFFEDNITLSKLQDVLTKFADSRNCDLVDVSFYDADTSYADASYAGIVGMLFGESTMGVSAILVPRDVANN